MRQKFFNSGLKFFKENSLKGSSLLVGVSGGLDSISLLKLLMELRKPMKLKLHVVYVHHGKSSEKKINLYRDKALKLVKKMCEENNIPFYTSSTKKHLKSEEEFRNLRKRVFKNLLKKLSLSYLVLAHNKEDLLETRLLNLIRGSGEKGLLSMKEKEGEILRPLLFFSRKEIKEYTKIFSLKFLEDPSNSDSSYLRNFLRKTWLPSLEKKRKGSVDSLSRSLETLSHFLEKKQKPKFDFRKGMDRLSFVKLSLEEQKSLVAQYMHSLGLKNYGLSHIEEVRKLALKREKDFKVRILKKTWVFTPGLISVRKD